MIGMAQKQLIILSGLLGQTIDCYLTVLVGKQTDTSTLDVLTSLLTRDEFNEICSLQGLDRLGVIYNCVTLRDG